MPEILTRKSRNRLEGYDYSQSDYYSVTICAQNRQQIFGTIINNQMTLNDAGDMVNIVLNQIPENYTGIDMDEHIVMPNHAHAIIIIQNIVGVDPRVDPEQNNNKISVSGRTQGSAPTKLSLSSIIKCVKSLTTKKYIDGIKNHNWPPFNKRLWQRNYHDYIIHNDKSLNNIREYIVNNPATWDNDENNVNNPVGYGHTRTFNNIKVTGQASFGILRTSCLTPTQQGVLLDYRLILII